MKLTEPLFTGAATALVTPFSQGRLELDAFDMLIEEQYDNGISALIVCGTTGESATLTPEEQETLYKRAVNRSAGKMKAIAGIGGNNTRKTMDMALRAEDAGADGLLMVTPYYNKTSQAGLIAHFTYVADRTKLPVILYNVPGRTGIGIQPETYAILADHPGITGVKEASGNIAEFARAKTLCGEKLTFWSGNDSDTVSMMALGAKGVISVASNIVPSAVSRLCALCLEGNFQEAAALNERYMPLFSILFKEVNPIPIKTAMELCGRCSGEMRLPLVPMSASNKSALVTCLKDYNLL